jgi:hypothetical protein
MKYNWLRFNILNLKIYDRLFYAFLFVLLLDCADERRKSGLAKREPCKEVGNVIMWTSGKCYVI